MRPFVLAATLVLAQAAPAVESLVPMSAEQIDHLDIRMAVPAAVGALPLVRAPGRVVLPPAKEFVVSALQAGVVSQVNVPLGVNVKKGQLLAAIQSTALLDLQRALLDAASAYDVAAARLNRDATLLREGVISRMRWQETKSDADRAEATLRAAGQTLLASGMTPGEVADLRASRRIDTSLEVRSPSDGFVLERMAVVGQRVDALSPLFRIGKLDELWLEVNMPQERLHEIRIGDRVTSEDPRATARIIEVGQSVDPQSQSALVRAVVEQGAAGLKPGMNLNVQLLHRSTDRIFRVPVAAVFGHEGRSYVFVKVPGGFEAREVAVAGQEPYSVTLHEGLRPGEAVVVQGVAALKAAWLGMGPE
jgi:cobalt-zinc-cadmium efflux system membrane fusion protein